MQVCHVLCSEPSIQQQLPQLHLSHSILLPHCVLSSLAFPYKEIIYQDGAQCFHVEVPTAFLVEQWEYCYLISMDLQIWPLISSLIHPQNLHLIAIYPVSRNG